VNAARRATSSPWYARARASLMCSYPRT
jgi:hypothetical protein